jgi:hypothetical protein
VSPSQHSQEFMRFSLSAIISLLEANSRAPGESSPRILPGGTGKPGLPWVKAKAMVCLAYGWPVPL